MMIRNYFRDTSQSDFDDHVTIVYGRTRKRNIAGLGGSQTDSINLLQCKINGHP